MKAFSPAPRSSAFSTSPLPENLPKFLKHTHPAIGATWAEAKKRLRKVPSLVQLHMVFHRGFHSFDEVPDLPLKITKKRPLTRPIENTIAAFSAVWTMGANLCECDIALTKDSKLVVNHDNTIERFRDESGGLPTLREQNLEALQRENLVDPHDFLHDSACDESLRNWIQIPTLAEVLQTASSIGSAKKLVVEIKADKSTAFETGQKLAAWVKQNAALAKHIAVVMSFSESALEGYHEEGASHGPAENDVTLMLLTVKTEDVSAIYQENPIHAVHCEAGMCWSASQEWHKPAHVDGYYMEVTMRHQMQWIAEVTGRCKNSLGIVLGAWTYPSDPNSFQHDACSKEYQTMSAADVAESHLFLVDKMGFTYVNTDFPDDFGSNGYITMNNSATNEKRHVPKNMHWPDGHKL